MTEPAPKIVRAAGWLALLALFGAACWVVYEVATALGMNLGF